MDRGQVECIERKRLLAFVNHFVTQTADFLAKFSHDCEVRLIEVEAKIGKMDTDLRLLEAKLESAFPDTPSARKT